MANAKIIYGKLADPRRLEALSSQRWELLPYLAGVMVLLTLVSIFHVWSRAKVVDYHLRIGELRRELREQQQGQTRLRLEVASLKTPARIESLAKGELGMALPADQQVVLVK